MLYISLATSCIFLLILNGAARSTERRPVVWIAFGLFVLSFASMCMMTILPAVILQSLALAVWAAVWRLCGWSANTFTGVSLLATAGIYGYLGIGAWNLEQEYEALRQRYPYESLEGRLPLAEAERHPTTVTPATEHIERELRVGSWWREHQLERLHERTFNAFVNSPGFGVSRGLSHPSESNLAYGLRTEPAPLQPAYPTYPPEAEPGKPAMDSASLHEEAVIDFVHPEGFGFFKDRNHVAGFQPHRFSKVPDAKDVEVVRLELVSLLMHKEPSVYLSDRLPQMDALKGVPTRPLDDFEKEGLEALRKGSDLFVQGDRMVGAVRSVKQCLACHGGERGQLLGAFTYTFRPAGK
jgi:hypothetical protein